MPTGLHGWLTTFGSRLLQALPPAERAAAQQEVVELCAPVLGDGAGNVIADYTRLRFIARV